MTTTTKDKNKKIHQGRNIKRFREMLGMKQDALAFEMGEDWNQQKISLLEQKETIEKEILQRLSEILKIPINAIENFDEESAINIITNTVNNSDTASGTLNYTTININPVEKWLEALDENKKLYERLLETEKEKVALMEKLLNK
ncbi:helix-turn-helix transcriptional regulator [Flavobacterium supellecticarium]|uniref:Helix-turn-helix transcriptional regulator n=1 Tax=Flavobacterium supellecticarium TaxID=2565924 RepID=A0A4S3ZZW2_9FLAO|nr:helix-turn-helix transcriptional regulator [Flavobacterium supellecticarium]THF51485.1 helix-turn-helix transcriptional regulator [Flavobacterium supellecticarium]